MVNFIFGKKGYGKTTICYEAIKEKIQNKQQIFFIVPEQQAVEAERSVIDIFENQSNLYVEVINFKRLCNRVFRESGGLARGHVDNAGKLLTLAKVQNDCQDLLKTYKNCASDTGFTKKLFDMVGQFQNSGASPSDLMKISQKLSENKNTRPLSDKLFDLSLIAAAYKEELNEIFGCQSDLLEILSKVLDSYHFFKGKTVILDSFYSFTKIETDIIKKIIPTAQDVFITFTWDGKSKDRLYLRSIQSYDILKSFCESYNTQYTEIFLSRNRRHNKDSGLYALGELFSTDCFGTKKDTPRKEDINIISCPDTYKECSCVSNIIHGLVKDGAKYRDICICVPDTERYAGIIDTVLDKNNIPYHMSVREKLTEQPIISLLISSFNLYLSGFSRNNIIRLIKSGICGLDFYQANILDRYIRTWNLSGSRFSDGNWDMCPSGYVENMSDTDQDQLSQINLAGQIILNLVKPFCEALKSGKNSFDYCTAVYEYLCVIAKINSDKGDFEQENAIYYKLVYDCLDMLCAVMKTNKLSVKRFFKLFELAVSQCDTGRIPSSLDQVEISTVALLRAENIKHMIIMGANQGVLPGGVKNASLFADEEKKLLETENIYLSSDFTEEIYDCLFLCMCASLSAKEKLFVVFSKKDCSGENLSPSLFISFLLNIFPNNKIINYPFSEPLKNLSGEETAFEELFTFEDAVLRQSLKNYFSSKPEYSDIISRLSNGPEHEKNLSTKNSHLLFGDKVISSVTRLETFNRCPFSYFSRYTLNLRPEPQAKLGATEIGNISHRVMEIFCKNLARKKASDGSVFTPQEAEKIIKDILEKYLDMFLHTNNSVSKRFVFLYKRISNTVTALAKSITNEMAQSLFAPSDFELKIDKNGDIEGSPIVIELNENSKASLEIIGQIDRVDKYESNGQTFVRIIDYKTGTKDFDKNEIAYGLNLQMLLYFFTILNGGKNKYGQDIVPCAVLYIPCVSPDKKTFLGQDTSDTDIPFTAKGIVVSDLEIIRAMERDVNGIYIPVTLKQDGSISARSKVVDYGEMLKLIENATKAASELAKEMLTGDISVSPYKCDELNSCAFCDYSSFCGFDKDIHSPRYNLEKKIPDET